MNEVKSVTIKQTKLGDITITIPRAYLRHAVTIMEDMPEGSRVTNTKQFSDSIVKELESEDGEGSTAVHLMLDAVINEAVESGCEGIKLGEEDY